MDAVDAEDGSLSFPTGFSINNNQLTLTNPAINNDEDFSADDVSLIDNYKSPRFVMFYQNQTNLLKGIAKAYLMDNALTLSQSVASKPTTVTVRDDTEETSYYGDEVFRSTGHSQQPKGFSSSFFAERNYTVEDEDEYYRLDLRINIRMALTNDVKNWINQNFNLPPLALIPSALDGEASAFGQLGIFFQNDEINFPEHFNPTLKYYPSQKYCEFTINYFIDRNRGVLSFADQSFSDEFFDTIDRSNVIIDVRLDGGTSVMRDVTASVAPVTPIKGFSDYTVVLGTSNVLGAADYTLVPEVKAADATDTTNTKSGAITLDNPAFNIASFTYDITTKAITLVLDGSNIAADSFFKLYIRNRKAVIGDDGDPSALLATLTASEATFDATAKSFTWANNTAGSIIEDPVAETGTYSFVFEIVDNENEGVAINKKVLGTKVIFTFIPFGDAFFPNQTFLDQIVTTFGITQPRRWESESLSAQAFSLNSQDYEIEKVVLSAEKVVVTFVKSQDNNADVNAMFLEVTADGGDKIEYIFSEKSGNVVTFVPSILIPGFPSGFSANFDETYSLKIPIPAKTLDDRLPSKKYGYLAIYSWVDQKGLNHYSEISNIDTISNKGEIGAVGASTPSVKITYLNLSEKQNAKIILYRTIESGSTYLRVGEVLNFDQFKDINFQDNVKDEDLGEPYLYGIDSVKFQPPGAPIAVTFRNRLYLTGSKEFTNRILVSDERGINSNAITFDKLYNDSVNLFFDYPVVGIAPLDQSLIIFTENKTYNYVPGAAPVEITALESITLEDHRSLAPFTKGILFKSTHGIYNLTRALTGDYIGFDVLDFNLKKVIDAKINEGEHEIFYVFDDYTTLKYNYYFNQWSRGVSPVQTMFYTRRSDAHRVISREIGKGSTIWVSDPNHRGDAVVKGVLETGFFNLADSTQGYHRVDEGVLLGEFGDFKSIKIEVAYDWNDAFEDTHVFSLDASNIIYTNPDRYGVSDPVKKQVSFDIKKPKSSSIKLRITIESKRAFISNIAFRVKESGQLSKVLPLQRG